MARYLMALVGVVVVVIGIYLFREVHGDPQPIAQTPVVAVRPEQPRAQPAQPSAGIAAGSALRPAMPIEVPPPAISAVPVANDPATVADEREAAKARLTSHSRAVFKPKPSPNSKLDRYQIEAQEALDKGDLDKAKRIAGKLLAHAPNSGPPLRILTAASCAEGNASQAQAYYAKMTPADRAAIKKQCAVPLTDPAP